MRRRRCLILIVGGLLCFTFVIFLVGGVKLFRGSPVGNLVVLPELPGRISPSTKEVCVLILATDWRRERFHDLSVILGKHDIFKFRFHYMYAESDTVRPDGTSKHVLPVQLGYFHLTLKLHLAMKLIAKDKRCDFVLKLDDDVILDFVLLAHVLAASGHDYSWMGSLRIDMPVVCNPEDYWYYGEWFCNRKNETGRLHPFMAGPMYILGKKLFNCLMHQAKELSPGVLTMRSEDVAVGLMVLACRKEIKDFRRLDTVDFIDPHLGRIYDHPLSNKFRGHGEREFLDVVKEFGNMGWEGTLDLG